MTDMSRLCGVNLDMTRLRKFRTRYPPAEWKMRGHLVSRAKFSPLGAGFAKAYMIPGVSTMMRSSKR